MVIKDNKKIKLKQKVILNMKKYLKINKNHKVVIV